MKSIEAGDKARPSSCAPVIDQVVIEHTRRWISSFVIGLGLCPFARRVCDAGQIRYAISHSRDEILGVVDQLLTIVRAGRGSRFMHALA